MSADGQLGEARVLGMTQSRFAGRVVVVTGGASGIGEATVRAFAREGAAVVVFDVDEAAGENLAQELVTGGGAALFAHGDVADESAVRAAVEETVGQYGRLDVMHANAGMGASKWLVDLERSDWQRVLDVNLTGAYLASRYALVQMRKQESGAIVLTSSPHALATSPGTGPYAASKAGMLGLTHSLAVECVEYGVRTNAVVPGPIDTPMVRSHVAVAPNPDEELAKFAAVSPMRRLGLPEEVAAAVLFLASDAASFVNGAVLAVDGGLLATLAGGIAYDLSG